ncbi:hypothetical protein OIU79_021570 [Salix purpurea]|uniref:Uncharacterized protein n=1 Tax=Salix purpurea TaxID=77065 RepID=A0A9Q0WDR2_SALPP|nr:hypothetical protein OIU79_021570 [Salix purpurea]
MDNIMLELDRNMNCCRNIGRTDFSEKAMDSSVRAANGDNKNYTSHNLDSAKILDLLAATVSSMIARPVRHSPTHHPWQLHEKLKFAWQALKVHRKEGLKRGD